MHNSNPDPPLYPLMQQKQSPARQVIAVLNDGRHVLPVRRQLADLKPHEHVYFGVDVGRAGRGEGAEFARAHGLRYGDGGGQHAARRLPNRALQFGVFVEGVLLVVAEDLEDNRVGFYVVDEGF